MAKTEAIEVPDELKNLQRKSVEQRDRFYLGVCQSHKREPSKIQKKIIKEKSLFGYLATFWRELTPEQKAVWSEAGAFSSLSNWQLYISDNAARIRNNLTLDVPPSDLWQVNAGRLTVEAPASQILLKQEHPQQYLVAQKVVGQSWKREIVSIDEVFSLPLELEIRYKSDLSSTGPTQSARYFARVWTSYQGVDIFTDYPIDFSPSADWTEASLTISGLRGIIIGYTLYIGFSGYTGTLLFDNIRAIHGGTNWALDPRCDAIDTTFKKAFASVPPFWIPDTLPSGASFESVYPPAL